MAPAKSSKLMVNAIIRETLSSTDKERLAWTGNILLLSSSLQPELAPDLGGVTGYALEPLLQVISNSSCVFAVNVCYTRNGAAGTGSGSAAPI
jgi:hypothetical protein